VLNLKHDGRPESFTGLVNVVLQRNRASWKITAFTWTDNQPNPPLSTDSSPLETVMTFFADWDMGEIRAASKLFDQEPCVTDAFPRFHWQGKKAFREWFSDLDIYNQSQGFTDYDFEVGTPLTNDVEGALANVIVPVVLNLKHDGRPESFTGLVNVVLQRNRASWKITAFTWTDNQPG
jgi:hypothetical protein